jgi:hypothetical protein
VRLLVVCLLFAAACKDDDDLTPELGSPCSQSDECASLCLGPSATAPGGLCTRRCATHDDCPATAVCATAVEMGVCLFACRDDRDCEFLESTADSRWTCQATGSVLACLGE